MRVRRVTAPGSNNPPVNKAAEFMQELATIVVWSFPESVKDATRARFHLVQARRNAGDGVEGSVSEMSCSCYNSEFARQRPSVAHSG